MPKETRTIVTCGRCGGEHRGRWGRRNLLIQAARVDDSEDAPVAPVALVAPPPTVLLEVEDICSGCYAVFERVLASFNKAYPGGRRKKKERKKKAGQPELFPPTGGGTVAGSANGNGTSAAGEPA